MAIILKFRASGGAAGAPASLKTGERAYNMADGKFYVGFGDDGSGNATSIKVYGKDDFVANVPAGGTAGQVLTKASGTDGDCEWDTFAPDLSAYAPLASPAFTGDPTAPTQAPGNNSTRVATTAFVGAAIAAQDFSSYAPIASPTFTGNVVVPNQTAGNNSTKAANTAYVDAGLGTKANTAHSHSAADITSGVFDIARIPVLPSQIQVVSSGAIAALDAGQQTAIGQGTVVTTTDGRRWVYSGSGSKTAEGSYVELADITPAWGVIASIPANVSSLAGLGGTAGKAFYFSATNTLTEYSVTAFGRGVSNWADAAAGRTDLGLGNMATQAKSAVDITGGTITGAAIDGGTF